MASEYRPRWGVVDANKCKSEVVEYQGLRRIESQCSRKSWKDGWCKQHHPESEAARAAKREEQWKMDRVAREAQYAAEAKRIADAKALPEAIALLRECHEHLVDGRIFDRIDAFLAKHGDSK
jgi:beta-phosphoglucomutase-like phosphatase (HAD superfamily)